MEDEMPLDTTADANEMQLRVYQPIGGAARVAAAFRLSAFVRKQPSPASGIDILTIAIGA